MLSKSLTGQISCFTLKMHGGRNNHPEREQVRRAPSWGEKGRWGREQSPELTRKVFSRLTGKRPKENVPADSCSRSRDPQLPHRLRSLDPRCPVSANPRAQAPLPCGSRTPEAPGSGQKAAIPASISSMSRRPKAEGSELPRHSAEHPETGRVGARLPPQPALASFPVPRRQPRAPQASWERSSYLCSAAGTAGPEGGGRGRWVLGAVAESAAARSSLLLPPLESLQPPREQRFLILGNFLNRPGRPRTSSRPRLAPRRPLHSSPRAPPAPSAPPAPNEPPAPGAPRELRGSSSRACEGTMERFASEARGQREGGEEPARCSARLPGTGRATAHNRSLPSVT